MPSAFSTDDRLRVEGHGGSSAPQGAPPEYRGRRRREPVVTAPATSTEPTLPLPAPELAAAVSVLPQQPVQVDRQTQVAPAPADAPRYLTRAEAKAAARAQQRAARTARTPRATDVRRRPATPDAGETRRAQPATGPIPQLRTPLFQRPVAPDANARRAPQRRDQVVVRPPTRRHRGLAAVVAVAAVGALGAVASAAGALPSAASDQAGAALGPQAAAAVGVVADRGQRSTEQSSARAASGLADSAFRMVAVSRSQERGPIAGCSGREPAEHYANGQLPTSILCALPFAPGHKLRADAAVRLIRLNEVYKGRFGSDLCLTDSYRSLASQYNVAARKPGLAARPGTSEHGWGLAIDVCGGPDEVGSARRAWFLENAPAFGWDNPDWARPGGTKPEPWHWEFVEGE
ncbi:MAG: D-alanyl-D-alanine carboxypeptidase family protein [Angustibacter sp.]